RVRGRSSDHSGHRGRYFRGNAEPGPVPASARVCGLLTAAPETARYSWPELLTTSLRAIEHPVDAVRVGQHSERRTPERVLERHRDLAAGGECVELGGRVGEVIEIEADVHVAFSGDRLIRWGIADHHDAFADAQL